MIKQVIQFLNLSLAQTNYFQQQFELCELLPRSDDQTTPKQYCTKGEWKEVSNFDSYNGVSYFRKNGDIKSEQQDENDSLIACSVFNKITIPLKLIAVIPREKLTIDDAYSDDRTIQSLIAFIEADTASLKTSIKAKSVYLTIDSWTTDNQSILEGEYSKINKKDINYKFIYCSIDLTAEIIINQECIIKECENEPEDICPPLASVMVANFSADDTNPTIFTNVQFSDLTTENPTSWLWDFGDGNTSTEQNPIHVYEVVGMHTVTLTAAKEGAGDIEIKTDYISAIATPEDPLIVAYLAASGVVNAAEIFAHKKMLAAITAAGLRNKVFVYGFYPISPTDLTAAMINMSLVRTFDGISTGFVSTDLTVDGLKGDSSGSGLKQILIRLRKE